MSEAVIALALNDLEEDRTEQVVGENLEQNPLFADRAVDQDVVLLHTFEVFAMTRHAAVDQLVIGVDRLLQPHAARPQRLDRLEDVVRHEGDVLNALAVIEAQELFDLGVFILAFVQRNADGAVRRDHRLAEQAGGLTLDVEVALLLEAEQVVVEGRPDAHLSAADIVRQVIQHLQAHAAGRFGVAPARDLVPGGEGIAIDQIEHQTANALDDLGVRQGRTGRIDGGRPFRQHRGVGQGRVGHAQTHAASRGTMLRAERGGPSLPGVQHQADIALPEKRGAIRRTRSLNKAELLQLRRHLGDIGRGELNEGEAVESERIRGGGRHGKWLRKWFHLQLLAMPDSVK